jgi:tetratricopeptide (TPR) repeat protein
VSLTNLHLHEEALATSEQAVVLCRTFDIDNPDKFRQILVKCLISQGAAYNALHRQKEALRVMQEVIKLNRAMAFKNPSEFSSSLAMSLANLGTFLSQGGHFVDALEASEEALTLYRTLAAEKPGEFDYEFAGTLINHSGSLADVDRLDAALIVAEEAVATYRKLSRDRPDEFLPALAKSVGALGLRLLAVDRNNDAIAAAAEACDIYRSLAADRPRQFLSGLAHVLKDRGVMLLRCERKNDSLVALDESYALYSDLARQRPYDFLPELAMVLGARSDTLNSLNRHEDAANSAREGLAAVIGMLPKLDEMLGGQDAALMPPALLNRVRMLAGAYIQACQKAEVGADLGLLQHAVHLLGGNMNDLPPDLKIAPDSKLVMMRKSDKPKEIDWNIGKRAGQHLDEGRFAEAETLFQEILMKCGETYGVHPYTATILGSLAETIHKAGRSDEAETLARQSLEMFERCLGGFHPDVASQRANLAGLLSDENKLNEAEALYIDAIRCLEADVSTETQTRLAIALHGLAGVLRSQGRLAEAAKASRRHLDILIDGSRRNGRPHPFLEKGFNAYGASLAALGSPKNEILKLLNDLGKGVGVSFGAKG